MLQEEEVLHEWAMSMGNSLDMQVMLKACLPVFLRGLNCASVAVLREDADGLTPVYGLPRNAPNLDVIVRDLRQALIKNAVLPMPFRVREGRYYYGWRLEGFGILLASRSVPFSPELCQELTPLANKLVVALRSCQQFSELTETRRQLIDSEQRWLMALEGAGHGVWDWDAATGKVFFSPVWKSMLGYDAADVGDSLEDWSGRVHPDDLPACMEDITHHFRGETPVYRNEHRVRCKDGSYRWVLDQGRVWTWRDGKPLRMVGTHTDITAHVEQEQALREAQQQAEAANQSKSAFLATMSHELRTPMNAIIGLTDIVLQSPLEDDQRELLGLVRSSADHLLVLINDILDLSRIEAGKMELHADDCVLREQLEAIASGLMVRAQDKALALTLEVDPAVPQCAHLDMVRLRQVLINLLGNAIKFTDQGGVRLMVHSEAGQLQCCVIDTGIGIAPEKQARIFEAFTQADSSVSRRYGGSGLGLAISSRIINLMGGRLWLESTLGEGSRFCIRVPLQACTQVFDEPAAPVAVAADALPPLKVLLAEDVATNQMLARLLLEKRGHRVQIAEDGVEAVAAWRAEPFDLILMDLMMPNLDGMAATRQIREAEMGGTRIPIIALTANAMAGDRQLCLTAGMNDHLAKPVNLAELFNALKRWLPHRTAPAMAALQQEPPATVPPAAPVQTLPELPGIDTAAGLAQVHGNVPLYRLLLGKFRARQIQQFSSEFTAAIAEGDLPLATRQAHSLKGVARTLGAAALGDLAAELEAACRAGHAALIATQHADLDRELHRLALALAALDN